jgi:hypothetical protein
MTSRTAKAGISASSYNLFMSKELQARNSRFRMGADRLYYLSVACYNRAQNRWVKSNDKPKCLSGSRD